MKETFIIKSVWKSVFDDLSDKQAGVLIKAVFEYIATGEKPAELQDLEVRMAFKFMALDLDAFKEKYEDKCAINRDNGMKGAVFGILGGRPRKSEKATLLILIMIMIIKKVILLTKYHQRKPATIRRLSPPH